MIGTSICDYIFVRFCIFVLHRIAPFSILYCLSSLVYPPLFYSLGYYRSGPPSRQRFTPLYTTTQNLPTESSDSSKAYLPRTPPYAFPSAAMRTSPTRSFT
ncbi:hypothetical protein GQ44DRAFT_718720 [Phaeosphaeriaceae sp. PMI808]|nr:hypothetical protein GQ44DRAFT_718720 [Phaeosphaeriaceae sp. PMI808]